MIFYFQEISEEDVVVHVNHVYHVKTRMISTLKKYYGGNKVLSFDIKRMVLTFTMFSLKVYLKYNMKI